ncbi:hypothetical protein KKC_09867 [Listeria fleischmannii subsp. coloradonensis]|nr:hypothetical protein KKC_09867 [Listeria fleischmannii subsp. coloradonensis]
MTRNVRSGKLLKQGVLLDEKNMDFKATKAGGFTR